MPNITILWGQCPEPHQEPITYKFETQAELDAFCLGVNEMDGWLGYEEIEEGYLTNAEVGGWKGRENIKTK
jgi:hypothetical protein